MWITKKAHWLIGKFLEDGFNHVVGTPSPIKGMTRWYVNGELVGDLGGGLNVFPFAMSRIWIEELCGLDV